MPKNHFVLGDAAPFVFELGHYKVGLPLPLARALGWTLSSPSSSSSSSPLAIADIGHVAPPPLTCLLYHMFQKSEKSISAD